MGHMYPTNLSRFFVRRLYAKGTLTIAQAVEAAQRAKEKVSCAEGHYNEDYMLSMAFEHVVDFLRGSKCYAPPCDPPVIVPVVEGLSEEQNRLLNLWLNDSDAFYKEADNDFDDEGMSPAYIILDSISWRFAPGMRRQYPDLPELAHVES